MPSALRYRQVDVFAKEPLNGNGLAVFIAETHPDAELMQALTRELRQFETIFLAGRSGSSAFSTRIFTMESELPFAGHPALGAAAVLHERAGGDEQRWQLAMPGGVVELASRRDAEGYHVVMNQGRPTFGTCVDANDERRWLDAFGLDVGHRDSRLPICVVSTGLPYLILPVTSLGLKQARILVHDLEARLATVGAAFAYLFDLDQCEGRTWDNEGLTEDIATGSAAGPVGALLVRCGLRNAGAPFVLNQGQFVDRPSCMTVEVESEPENPVANVILSGPVRMVGRGSIDEEVTRRISTSRR
jgi:PhzF family phenazine biosynthesis protein